MPVSAKMRLGFEDDSRTMECAHAIVGAGACELVVHARTKADGYRPPAYWERVAPIRAAMKVPVIANGEIWTVRDAMRARDLSGCTPLMLGRGMVSDPGLALAIVAADRGADGDELSWDELQPLLRAFWALVCAQIEPRHCAGRMKQWLNYLRRRHPQAEAAYQRVRTINDPQLVAAHLGLVPQTTARERASDLLEMTT